MKDEDSWTITNFMAFALALVTAIIVLTMGSCCIHVDYRISQAIKAGADPILARAAFSNSDRGYERVIHLVKEKR